jgi:hypothetical protein
MHEPHAKSRFRFTLRAFLLVIAAVALWLGWNAHQVNKRREIEKYILSTANKIYYGEPEKPWRSMPLVWRLFGATPVRVIDLRYQGIFDHDDYERIQSAFPEADVYPTRLSQQ